MKGPAQLTFTTMGGKTVTVQPRGKNYIQPRGYVDHPGTGPKGETCGSCRHHVINSMSKQYHKCDLARAKWTGGRASDILVRAEACSKWAPAISRPERDTLTSGMREP